MTRGAIATLLGLARSMAVFGHIPVPHPGIHVHGSIHIDHWTPIRARRPCAYLGDLHLSGRFAATLGLLDKASHRKNEQLETLIAVWDGQPGVEKGGTGSVLEYACTRGIPVEVVWPAGAERVRCVSA